MARKSGICKNNVKGENLMIKEKICRALERDGVVILPPSDVFDTIALLQEANIHTDCTILDPWYNKGFGGVLPDAEYDEFIRKCYNKSSVSSGVIGTAHVSGSNETCGECVFPVQMGDRCLVWYYFDRNRDLVPSGLHEICAGSRCGSSIDCSFDLRSICRGTSGFCCKGSI